MSADGAGDRDGPLRVWLAADLTVRFGPVGGAQRVADLAAHGLADRGHQVTVLQRTPHPGDGPAVEPGAREVDGVRYVLYDATVREGERGGPAGLVGLLRAARAAARTEAERARPDVILAMLPLTARGVLGAPGVRDVPAAYWFHSPWSLEYRERHGRGRLRDRLHEAVRRHIEGGVLLRCRRILCAGEAMRAVCLDVHPALDPGRVGTAPYAVDEERFRPAPDRAAARAACPAFAGIPPDVPLGFTARHLVPRTGVDLLVEAVADCGRDDLHVVVAGSGPERADLEALAARRGVADRVRFAGFVPEENLPGAWAGADFSVTPTRALEGFGLSTAESLMSGTPALVTDVGANPELVRDLDPRWICPADDLPGGLSRAPDLAAEEPDGWAARCRAHAEARWSRAVFLDTVEAHLAATLAADPAPGERR